MFMEFNHRGFCNFRSIYEINPSQPGTAYAHSLKTLESLKVFLMFPGGVDKQRRLLD